MLGSWVRAPRGSPTSTWEGERTVVLSPSFLIYNYPLYPMTQITLTITDPKDASLIKKLLAKFDSVTISKPARRRKTGIDEALEDVKAGRVYHCDSVEDFFKEMGV